MTEKRTKNHACHFNHTRICPHLQLKGALWCQVCVMTEILKEIKALRVTQGQ